MASPRKVTIAFVALLFVFALGAILPSSAATPTITFNGDQTLNFSAPTQSVTSAGVAFAVGDLVTVSSVDDNSGGGCPSISTISASVDGSIFTKGVGESTDGIKSSMWYGLIKTAATQTFTATFSAAPPGGVSCHAVFVYFTTSGTGTFYYKSSDSASGTVSSSAPYTNNVLTASLGGGSQFVYTPYLIILAAGSTVGAGMGWTYTGLTAPAAAFECGTSSNFAACVVYGIAGTGQSVQPITSMTATCTNPVNCNLSPSGSGADFADMQLVFSLVPNSNGFQTSTTYITIISTVTQTIGYASVTTIGVALANWMVFLFVNFVPLALFTWGAFIFLRSADVRDDRAYLFAFDLVLVAMAFLGLISGVVPVFAMIISTVFFFGTGTRDVGPSSGAPAE